jgi:hypothetical protein
MTKLSAIILAVMLMTGCYRPATPPQVTTTTTITCPAGTQLQSDGMCRPATTIVTCAPGTVLYADGVCRPPATTTITCPPGTRLYSDGVCR